jgi:hypothetical protein
MGVLTDFVVADPSDGERVAKSPCASREFDGLDAKGIDTVKLGKLYSILTGDPFDPSFPTNSGLRFEGSEDGPWVFQVPPDMVERLAGLGASETESVARQWAQIQEFAPKYSNWSAAAVGQLLGQLAALCRKAVAEKKVLFMWMCL